MFGKKTTGSPKRFRNKFGGPYLWTAIASWNDIKFHIYINVIVGVNIVCVELYMSHTLAWLSELESTRVDSVGRAEWVGKDMTVLLSVCNSLQ